MTSGDYALLVFGALGAVMAAILFGAAWLGCRQNRKLRQTINDSPLNRDSKDRMQDKFRS